MATVSILVGRPTSSIVPKKYQNRHFVLQAGIYIHLMWKNVLYRYSVDTNVDCALLSPQIRKT